MTTTPDSSQEPVADQDRQPSLFADAASAAPPSETDASAPTEPSLPPVPSTSTLRSECDVVVVGAGIAGLAAAAVLARGGFGVTLLEGRAALGGVCRSLEVGGQRCDLASLLLPGCGADEALELLTKRLGLSLSVRRPDPILQVALARHRVSLYRDPKRWWAEIAREFPAEVASWHSLFAELDGLVEDREELLRNLPLLPPEGWRARWRARVTLTTRGLAGKLAPAIRRIRRGMGMPLAAALDAHGLGPASRQVLEAWLWFLRLRGAGACSMLEAAVALARLRRGITTVGSDTGDLAEALAAQMVRDAGTLRLETPVRRCLVERGRVVGVETQTGDRIRARFVVTDLAPAAVRASLSHARGGWFRRPPLAPGWAPAGVAQALLLTRPSDGLPAELGEHCLVVPRRELPARDVNVVALRRMPSTSKGAAPGCLAALRILPAEGAGSEAEARTALLAALDQVIPGVAESPGDERVLYGASLEASWGRLGVGLADEAPALEWLGERGAPHALGWPGLFVVGDWTHPGRLLGEVLDGATAVSEVLLAGC